MTSNPLTAHLTAWKDELSKDCDSEFLLDGFTHGFRITDSAPKMDIIQERNNYKSATCPENRNQVEKQLLSEIAKGHYVITDNKPSIISALGAIPKKDTDELRIIHDCSQPIDNGVNSLFTVQKHSFESVDSAIRHLKPHGWLAKVDLKSAYRHVGIHPQDYKVMGLKYHFSKDNRFTYFYDTRLCFGASASVGIFHRITQSIVRMMHRQGHNKVMCYLDDFLLIGDTKTECQKSMDKLLQLLHKLGFTINWSKVVYPTQNIDFLGININSTANTLTIPKDKLQAIKQTVNKWIKKTKATKRELQSLIGIINWAAKCVKAVRPILHSLINLVKKLKKASHRIRIPRNTKLDLLYFNTWCTTFNGVVLFNHATGPQPCNTVFTDASPEAGGAYCCNDFLYSCWKRDYPHISPQSIYVKEMCAILLAFHRWSAYWQNKPVYIYTDNQAAEWAIKSGLTKCPGANDILREILWISAVYNIQIHVSYISTKRNYIADAISRMHEDKYLNSVIQLFKEGGVDLTHPLYNWCFHMSQQSLQFILGL